MVETLAPISWGDEIKPDSVWSWLHLGFGPLATHSEFILVRLSRDGSRRIVQATTAGIPKVGHWLSHHVESPPDDSFQPWEGLKLHVEWVKDNPAQTVLMMPYPKGPGRISYQNMTGLFMPNGVIAPQTRPVTDPVNPIPATSKLRDSLSSIAAGWDVVWHSRYIFSHHLRQQVTGRLVDGLLGSIEHDIQTLLTNARPTANTDWKAKLLALETATKAVCGFCTGDPYVWARALARNIDIEAFRLRLDQGQIPAVNLTTKPWQPGTTVASITFPPNTDVNAKKELVARWHDTNKAMVENDLLSWHDEVFLDPEPQYDAADDHFHQR